MLAMPDRNNAKANRKDLPVRRSMLCSPWKKACLQDAARIVIEALADDTFALGAQASPVGDRNIQY
jgi:hypothetical protein